ncbi:MAG: hypothetical protein AAF849_08075 [Bacteroidota bacterium]
MPKHIFLVVLLFCCFPFISSAQTSPPLNEGDAILVNFSYGYQFPQADLDDRFGSNGIIHAGVEYLTDNNFIFGLGANMLFGNVVKQDVLAGLRTQEGFLIANDRQSADVQLRQRGMYLSAWVGKLFSIDPNNPRSGVRAAMGAGLLQHRIRIQDEPQRVVAPLVGDYRKGYDRLTNGLAISQFIGYQLLSKDRRINFTLGFEAIQGFTQNRRAFNFDTQMQDTKRRLDVLLGGKLTWTLPFYLGTDRASEIIY